MCCWTRARNHYPGPHQMEATVNGANTVEARRGAAKRSNLIHGLATGACVLALLSAFTVARAVDGCVVLLCLAAPSWSAIPQCVPPIRELFRDLARGRVFPTCGMSGSGNSAAHQWANAPTYCPPQYTRVFDGEIGPIYSCDYSGAVSVNVDGTPWTRTWWTMGGTVTEYTPAAKAQLGTWDTKFDDDYATWLASLPPPPPPCDSC